ncbi:Agamous-like MADS-box protein AGL29 [Linum perenne]
MTLVKDKRCRQVTLSKRRTSLFKKTRKLATLYVVHIAMIFFSPNSKPFASLLERTIEL